MRRNTSTARSVGADLLSVLPENDAPWYRQKELLKLNVYIISLAMSSSASGYDGSMMNGLQALKQWQEFMDHPTGAWLGFINAIQSIGAARTYPVSAWTVQRFGRRIGV